MHLARIFYLLIDPFRQNDIFSRPTDRVLHELIFSFIICIFFVLLIVWTGLYWTFKSQKEHKILFQMKTRKSTHEQTKTLSNVQSKTGRYYILKIFMIVALALVYPVQIIFSYLRGLRNFNQDLLNYCLYGLLGLIFLFILSFLFFTLRLKDILSKTYENPSYHTSNIIIKKVPHSNNKVSNSKQVNKEEINKFIKEISTNKMVQGVVKTIIDKNVKTNPNEDSDSEMDYQDEMAELDINIYNKSPDVSKDDIVILSHMADQEHSDMKGDDDRIQAKLTKNGTITSKKRENEYVLKETDISILNRIFTLSYIIIALLAAIIALGYVIRGTGVLQNPGGTITVLCLSFLIEVVAIISVHYLFVIDIQDKEYDNLKVIGDISFNLQHIRDKRSKVKFRELNTDARNKNFIEVTEKLDN